MSSDHEQCVARAWEDSPPKVLDRLRFHIFLCTDGKDFCGCEANGNAALSSALRQELAKRRLMASVKINIMQCRQPGNRGPVLVVHPDGIWYDGLRPGDVPEFVDQQILRGQPLDEFVMRGAPQPVTAVPAHIVAASESCTDRQTPEQQFAALAPSGAR
jgi:(2Fe-2S) ferredoxin